MATAIEPGDRRIDLARVDAFRLGAATVCPAFLEIRCGSNTEVVEPRVMQMLVALHRAAGAPVSRDDLIAECWGGLSVSDDAITQCVSKLRRSLPKAPDVQVLSVPRVGYRLIAPHQQSAELRSGLEQPARRVSKREAFGILVAALGLITTAAIGIWTSGTTRHVSAKADSFRTPQEQKADQLHDAAVKLFRERTQDSVTEAERLLRHAVALDPGNAPSWARLGMAIAAPGWWATKNDLAIGPKRQAEAIGYIKRALAIDADLAEAHEAMGFVLWSPDSVPWLQKAVQLDPENGEAWDQLAQLQLAAGELQAALQSTRRARAIDPTWVPVVQTSSEVLSRLGRWEEAYGELDRVEAAAGRSTDIAVVRCRLKAQEGKLADAMRICADALAAPGPKPWYAEITEVGIARLTGDEDLIRRFVRAQPDLALVVQSADDGERALRLAKTNPDEWWDDLFPGSLARHLLLHGESDVLLSLYDRRYGSTDDFLKDKGRSPVTPPLILAMRTKGRAAEASALRRKFAQDARYLEAQGDRTFEVQLRLAQLAALDGDAPKAANHVRAAIGAGWIGQKPWVSFAPDKDPIYAGIRSSPPFKQAIQIYYAAVDRQRREVDVARRQIDWTKLISPKKDLRSNA